MYYDYWNLHKMPFDNVPDPSMYADCHTSMHNVISETIFAIKEANEVFAVIIGTAGSGKTLSLRMIIDALEPDKYKTIVITNPGTSYTQLLRDIISKISGSPCDENKKSVLLDMFHALLLTTMKHGQKIVIFIDEANALSPANLENLRLLTNMQEDEKNLFTLILAGQIELAQRLEHPKRANLFQRIGTYGRIDKLSSPEAVKTYIETRLQLAGTKIKIFSEDCIPIIWEFSEHGIPRLVNKICKLCLKVGETNHLDYISSDIALHIADGFKRIGKTAVQKRRPRSRPEEAHIQNIFVQEIDLEKEHFIETDQTAEQNPLANKLLPQTFSDQAESLRTDAFSGGLPCDTTSLTILSDLQKLPEGTPTSQNIPDHIPNKDPAESIIHSTQEPDQLETHSESEIYLTERTSEVSRQEESIKFSIPFTQSIRQEPLPDSLVSEPIPKDALVASSLENREIKIIQESISNPQKLQPANDHEDEILIGEHKIKLAVPKDILRQVKSFNLESANKSAGFWAAQIIKNNPQLTSSPLADPVHIWNEIKDSILKRITL